MMDMATATEIATRVVVATLIGSGIGLDRELRHRPAGLKTHALVALGAATVVAATASMTNIDHPDSAAMTRVIQGVIAGIGFLGGGAILKSGGEMIQGLTTAASIWVVAAIGIACGAGEFAPALIALVIALVVLIFGNAIERRIGRRASAAFSPPPPSGSGPERP
ncbi:MAG TPA: MgtC/SapB family protein [Thermoanaerobaculia bacterium]|nr:MgtC/SapB family protein [Thermoanaerobaculia bacterium]